MVFCPTVSRGSGPALAANKFPLAEPMQAGRLQAGSAGRLAARLQAPPWPVVANSIARSHRRGSPGRSEKHQNHQKHEKQHQESKLDKLDKVVRHTVRIGNVFISTPPCFLPLPFFNHKFPFPTPLFFSSISIRIYFLFFSFGRLACKALQGESKLLAHLLTKRTGTSK